MPRRAALRYVPGMTRALLTALLLTATLTGPMASAQPAPAPAVTQNVKYTAVQKLVKIATVNGRRTETLVASPLTVVRGDVLVEAVSVQNVGTTALPQVTVTMPMPGGTSFTGMASPGTARITLSYSTDGGRNFTATPQRISSVTENGKTVLKKAAATMAEVTNVRWVIRNVARNEIVNLSYRVKVD